MASQPATNKGRSGFLARHENRIRRVDSAITRLRKTARASRLAARASRKGGR